MSDKISATPFPPEGIIELNLSGERIDDLAVPIARVCEMANVLYEKNKQIIKQQVPANYTTLIDIKSGKLFASQDVQSLQDYLVKSFPRALLCSIDITSFSHHHVR